MIGGQAILLGLALLLAFVVAITRFDLLDHVAHLIVGCVPLVLFVVGGVLVSIGISDLRGQKGSAPGSAPTKE